MKEIGNKFLARCEIIEINSIGDIKVMLGSSKDKGMVSEEPIIFWIRKSHQPTILIPLQRSKIRKK